MNRTACPCCHGEANIADCAVCSAVEKHRSGHALLCPTRFDGWQTCNCGGPARVEVSRAE